MPQWLPCSTANPVRMQEPTPHAVTVRVDPRQALGRNRTRRNRMESMAFFHRQRGHVTCVSSWLLGLLGEFVLGGEALQTGGAGIERELAWAGRKTRSGWVMRGKSGSQVPVSLIITCLSNFSNIPSPPPPMLLLVTRSPHVDHLIQTS